MEASLLNTLNKQHVYFQPKVCLFRNFSHSDIIKTWTKITHIIQVKNINFALESRQSWAGVCRLFSKSMKEKILNFLHEVEKAISVISIQV